MSATTPTAAVRRRPVRAVRAAGVVVAGVLALAGLTACGGSSGGDEGAQGSATETTKADASQSDASKSDAAKSESPTTAATKGTISAGDMADDMVAAFNAVAKGDCSKAKAISDKLDSSDVTGASMATLAEGIKKAAANGPSEIRADLKVFADAIAKVAAVYTKYGLDDPTKMASISNDPAKMGEVQAAIAAMSDPAVQKASDNIEKWINARCPGLSGTTK